MAMQPVDFNNQTWPTSSTDISAERTTNLYPVAGRPNRHSLKEVPPVYLYSTEGCTVFADSGLTAPVRGCIEVAGVGYVVVGNKFYSITAGGSATLIATIGTSSGNVSMASIVGTVGFVDGSLGYMYNITTTAFQAIVLGLNTGGPGITTAGAKVNDSSIVVDALHGLQVGYTVVLNMDGISTTLNGTTSAGSPTLVVSSGTGFASGGNNALTVILDNGTHFSSLITNVAGTTITIADNLPTQASSGAVVTCNSTSTTPLSAVVGSINGLTVTFSTAVITTECSKNSSWTWTYTSGFPAGATSLDSSDGYFITHDPNTQNVRISNLNSGLLWTPGDYIVASTYNDTLVRCVVYQQNIVAFGTDHLEQFFDSGNVLFAFQSERGSAAPFGLAAEFAVCITSTSLAWLSRSPRGGLVPVFMNNNTIVHFMNAGVIEEINSLSVTSDAIMFSYVRDSHEFVVLTFPTAGKTYVYDIELALTHERESLDPVTFENKAWFPSCFMNLGTHLLCGDSRSGKLMELSAAVYTENGVRIRRRRRIPALMVPVGPGYPMAGTEYKTINRFELRFQTSTGLASGQGSNPTVMLRASRDGGHTWDGEMWRSLGGAGQFYDVAIWDGLGTARKWCMEVEMSDPVNWKLLEAYADIEDGNQ